MAARPSAFGDDFGQKIDLTARIREILVNYPPGSTIIKEFLQNADGSVCGHSQHPASCAPTRARVGGEGAHRRSGWGCAEGRRMPACACVRHVTISHTPARCRRTRADAGASTIKFCVDERSFGTESLAHEKLGQFQVRDSGARPGARQSLAPCMPAPSEALESSDRGTAIAPRRRGARSRPGAATDCARVTRQGPALLVYNNGVFSDEDFESIQSIGDSKKRGQLAKTGRFGIGFNSCYHLTEVPTFLSRSFLVMFDPQAKFLPDVNPANPGKRIDILSPTVQAHFADQIAPYAAFGSDLKSEFNGTLFRLPLRTGEQAESSRLSKIVHSTGDLLDLLREFQEEAQQSLLFLKNVAHIEVLHWRVGSDAPQSMWTCQIANPSKSLAEARSLVPAAVALSQKAALQDKTLGFKHTQVSERPLRVRLRSCASHERLSHARAPARLRGKMDVRPHVRIAVGMCGVSLLPSHSLPLLPSLPSALSPSPSCVFLPSLSPSLPPSFPPSFLLPLALPHTAREREGERERERCASERAGARQARARRP